MRRTTKEVCEGNEPKGQRAAGLPPAHTIILLHNLSSYRLSIRFIAKPVDLVPHFSWGIPHHQGRWQDN
jgi:hypothetical protein